MNIRVVFSLLFTFFIAFMYGQDPASLRWKYLDNNGFRVIYPDGNDSMARVTLMMLNVARENSSYSMGLKPRKLPVVLHNQSSMSNGMVTPIPRHSEFWHTPMQVSLDPLDWTASLAVHEYRHVVQFDMIRQKGFGKLMSYLFGDIGVGMKSIYSPSWFYEGDAVVTETALTPAGRGRSSLFLKDIKAQVIDKKIYSYSKAVLRSYRNYVPNHYVLGYTLVAYGRTRWGNSLWRNAHQRVGSRFFGIRPFNTAISNQIIVDRDRLYEWALADFKDYWQKQIKLRPVIECTSLQTSRSRAWTNYTCPAYLTNDEFVAIKSGMANVPTIVRVDDQGVEEELVKVPFMASDLMHTNRKQIVWDEAKPHPRWTEKSYSNIITYDIATGQRRQLTSKSYLYAPAISNDGSKVVAVEVTPRSTYALSIIDAQTGRSLARFAPPGGLFPMTPRWSDNDQCIIMVLLGKQGKQIASLDTRSGAFSYITQPSFTDVANPMFDGQTVLYTSEYNGNNEVYLLDTVTRKTFLVTSSRFGVNTPSLFNNSLIYSYYTADGYAVGQQNLRRSKMIPRENLVVVDDTIVRGLLRDERSLPDFFAIDSSVLALKSHPYRKLSHAINPHSWGFLVSSPNFDPSRTEGGISILSDDLLSTTHIATGYKYDNLGSKKFYTEASYVGLFPVFALGFETGNHGFIPTGLAIDTLVRYAQRYYYKRTLFSQSMSLPLDFSSGAYRRLLVLSLSNYYELVGNVYKVNNYQGDLAERINPRKQIKTIANVRRSCDYLTYQGSFKNVMVPSTKDILPRFGQTFKAGMSHGMPAFVGTSSFSARYFAIAGLYLPGLLQHHSIYLSGGYSREISSGSFRASNPVTIARGFKIRDTQFLSKILSVSANYTFPVLNPDIKWGSLAYFKRIYANLFLDYSTTSGRDYNSFGIEANIETHFFNLPVPVILQQRISIINNKAVNEYGIATRM